MQTLFYDMDSLSMMYLKTLSFEKFFLEFWGFCAIFLQHWKDKGIFPLLEK